MQNKSKKIMIINTILVLIVFLLGTLLYKVNAVTRVTDKDLAILAENNTNDFLSTDIYGNYGTVIDLYGGSSDSDATISVITAACVDETHAYQGDGSYTAKAIIDIDNSTGYTDSEGSHSGLVITTADGTTTRITDSDLIKRARFLARVAYYIQYESGCVTGSSQGPGVTQGQLDGFFEVNAICFANHIRPYLDDFTGSYDDQSEANGGTGWQRALVAGIDYRTTTGVFNTAVDYANNAKASGISNKSVGEATYEFTDTETIIGPYRIEKDGDAQVASIQVKEKGGSTYNAVALDANKNEISLDAIPNNSDFYIKVDKILSDVETITVNGTGSGVIEARLIMTEGAGHQRLSIFGSVMGGGQVSFNLTPPPAKPIIAYYKYINSISRLQDDGTYKTLFTLPESEIPQITVTNAGRNDVAISSVTYPDYSKYTEVDESGRPIVYDGDKIEYKWVIYNIGPGSTTPGITVDLTDKADKGLVLDETNTNGWTESGSTDTQNIYKKTITVEESLTGLRDSSSQPSSYSGSDTSIYLEVVLGDLVEANKEPQVLSNNSTNPVSFKEPKYVAYKYIKSIQRRQKDGSYTTLFDVDDSDKPILTVANAGRNDAYVTNVTYPDYKKYTSESELADGVPIVYDGDKVEYRWVIYNIGPGASRPGDTYTLVDEPEPGLELDTANGWTENNDGNYEKTITLQNSLPGLTSANNSPSFHMGEETSIYFKVNAKDKIDNAPDDDLIYNNGSVPLTLRFRLSGILFFDQTTDKPNEENGYFDTESGDYYLVEYNVYLYKDGQRFAQTQTDSSGYYEFNDLDISGTYYVSFEYNGQLYEPTTYDCQATTDISRKSYGTDGVENRQNFNKKFENVNGNSNFPDRDDVNNPEFIIYAYTGPDGEGSRTYTSKDTVETLENINFGIKAREQFDLNLRKDLVNVELSINGKTHTYEYPGGELPLPVEIRGTDVQSYERQIRKEDLAYRGADKLEAYITYIIQIQNESVGEITGYVTDLNDYYDSSYIYVDSWDENNNAINWTQSGTVSGNGVTLNKMHTTDLANEGITNLKYVYVRFQLTDETIEQLSASEEETTENNFSEIAAYRNTYTNDRYDKNDNKITNAGEVAGLLDVDSVPDNMDPVSTEVQNFIKESRTEEYQNLSGEEKTQRSREVFEDDADSAPGLRIIPEEPRTISGVVFEDSPLADKLQDNERIGDGEFQDGEFKVNQVNVELIEIGNNDDDVNNYYPSDDNIGADGNHISDVSVRTNNNGEYTITGYIPGDYILRFTYGDNECLVADQPNSGEMYTGQDFKSTLYTRENYEGENNYWYAETSPRSNDATDNQDRREEVNSYSRTLQYSNATVLDQNKDSSNLAELADKTYMFAETATMYMEIEYTGDETQAYNVTNVDFGVIERPRTKIVLHKNVETVKLTAVDGSTIFDASDTAPELTWKENEYNSNRELISGSTGLIEGTVDDNLLYGSTAQVSYTFKITNDSEIDYNDLDYYEKGIKPADSKLNKINVNKIIDYVPNIFFYDENLAKSKGEIIINEYAAIPEDATGTPKAEDQNLWQVKKLDDTTLDSAEYRVSGSELLAEDVFDSVNSNINTVIQFPASDYPSEVTSLINSDPTQSKGLLAPSGELELKDALTITRVISSNEDLDNSSTPIENVAEIIQLTIDNGRRPYYESTRDATTGVVVGDNGEGGSGGPTITTLVTETPGNANPMEPTTWLEVDTAVSEEVHFIVPFGDNRQVALIIVLVAALGILVIGIYIIRKKVLLK